MIDPKILVVEDDKGDRDGFESSVRVYNAKNTTSVSIEFAVDIEQAKKMASNRYDGVVIDLKIAGVDEAGIEFVQHVNNYFRIPTIVLTGTPDTANGHEIKCMDVISKRDARGCHSVVLDKMCDVYRTGLTKILGGKGVVEESMSYVFWNSVMPRVQKWIDHNKNGINTEIAIHRLMVSHFMEYLDRKPDKYLAEEFYIYPVMGEWLRTGSVVLCKKRNEYHVVVTPACDLELHEGKCKTDKVLLCGVENPVEVARRVTSGVTRKDKQLAKLSGLIGNNFSNYYYWLPKIDDFAGGALNFRHLHVVDVKDVDELYEKPTLQIAGSFLKDMVSRYAAYYARQGQPDLDFELEAALLQATCVAAEAMAAQRKGE